MEMETVPSGVLHRGVDLDTISKDTVVDPHWQVNQAVSHVRTSRVFGAVVGLLGNIGMSAAIVVGAMVAGVSPAETDLILGVGFLASMPVAFPLGFTLFRHSNRRNHYLASMNRMGIFDKQDRARFMKTMKSLPANQALFVQTPPSRNGDIGIWKVTADALIFHGIKPGDGGWEDALEQVIAFYDLTTRAPMKLDAYLGWDFEDDFEDELEICLRDRKVKEYAKQDFYSYGLKKKSYIGF